MKSQLKMTTIQRILWWTKQIHRLQAISPWRQQWECLSPLVGNQGPMEGATNGQDSPLHQRCTKEFIRRAFVTNDDDDDKVVNVDRQEKYQLKSLKGTSIYVCYGCGQRMHPKPSNETGRYFVPPAPFDVVFCRRELKMYKKPSGELTYSITPQNVYYHMKKACIQKKNGNFTSGDISISEEFLSSLMTVHVSQLRKEFGLSC